MLASPSASGENDEVEVLVDCDAVFEPYLLEFGATAINGRISPTTDTDVFVICVQGGESLDVCLDAVGPCTYWDPLVRVFDPANALIATGSCQTDCYFGPASCSVCVTVSAPVPGCYTILVSDSGADDTGAFQLHVEEVVPTRAVPVLPYAFGGSIALEPTTDHDWRRFFGKGGSTIEVAVDQQGPCTYVDPRYALFAPDGSLVASGGCDTDCYFGPPSCSIREQVVLPSDGIYTLRLWDGGEDDVGTLLVTVDCFFGCPPLNQHLSRNGSGSNPATYDVAFPAVPGAWWEATVDAGDHPGAQSSVILMSPRPAPMAPLPTPYGELLIDLFGGRYYFDTAPVPAAPSLPIARHARRVPPSPALLGTVLRTQAATVGGGRIVLRNAVDYVLGY